MTRLLLVGAGLVAYRTAQQLVGTDGIDQLVVADRNVKHAAALVSRIGGPAVAFQGHLEDAPASDFDAVAVAVPARAAIDVVTAAIAARIPTATVTDEADGIAALLALDACAFAAGVPVVVGCGLAPGVADVLAGHAAALFDEVDEVHLARVGSAGPCSVDAVRAARRARPAEIVAGVRCEMRRSGDALVWFPDPLGAHECVTVAAEVRLVADAVPGVRRVTVRFGEPEITCDSISVRRWRPHRSEPYWGGARAEVWGWRDGRREVVIYGLVEHTDIAAGTTLAVTAAALAGIDSVRATLRVPPPGAHGLASVAVPSRFLAELARRGVRAATFEGRRPGGTPPAAPGNIGADPGT